MPRYGPDFFERFDLVMNALDNLDARRHVNRCRWSAQTTPSACMHTHTMVVYAFRVHEGAYIVEIYPGALTNTHTLPHACISDCRLCLAVDKPLVESGTTGYLGQVPAQPD